MIPLRLIVSGLVQRPLRSILTVLSVVSAVASVVAVAQAMLATKQQMADFHNAVASRVSFEIVAIEGGEFDPNTVPDLKGVKGVASVVPVCTVFTSVSFGERQVRVVGTGIEPELLDDLRDVRLAAGRYYEVAAEACLEKSVADRLGVVVGDKVTIRTRGVPLAASRTVVGIIEFPGLGILEEHGSVFLRSEEAARLNRTKGMASSVYVVVSDSAQEASVRSAVLSLLPSDLVIADKVSPAEIIGPTEVLVDVSLNIVALLSVVAAIFIVVNTFQISVRERQPLFALLRVIGATQGQIRSAMVLEALVFGVVGTVFGIIAGMIGGNLIAGAMKNLYSLPMPVPSTSLVPIAMGVVFGPLVTLISVWYPSRIACGIPPLSIMRALPEVRRGLAVKQLSMAGVVVLAGAVAMLLIARTLRLSSVVSVPGIVGLQIAALLLLPALIRPGVQVVYRVFERFCPVESLLGYQQIVDNFGRSSLTTAVMFIVTAASISIGNSILYVTHDIQTWVDSTVSSDFLLRASRPQIDMSAAEHVPDEVRERLSVFNGLADVDQVSFSLVTVREFTATMAIREFRKYEYLPLSLIEGGNSEVRDGMMNGDVVIGTVLASKLGVHQGDSIRIRMGSIEHEFRIAGVAREYTAGGLMIMIDRAMAMELFPVDSTHVYLIRAQVGKKSETQAIAQKLAAEEGLIFQSLADIRELIQRMVAGITNGLWLILMLSFLIAAFAIVNTLTMNVIEQTRYLGMLRVIGIARGQVFRMFLMQAIALAVVAIIPGVLIGIGMSWTTSVAFEGVSDHAVQFRLDSRLVMGYPIAALTLAVLAASLPSFRAGRLRPLEAVHAD
ncbi:MAG: FtsX-like permease family protein [Planctomyces sp.]|nr:FtsX-like permease family protein [Planctomyces sp.]